MSRMRRVGLTGGIATGKSHVLRTFAGLGVPVVDADVLAREAVAPGTQVLADIVRRFGADVLDASGALNRRALAAIVFEHPSDRQALEAIVHPEVQRAIDAWFAALPPAQPFAIADIPLLFETGRQMEFDDVIVVACDPDTQVTRVMDRDGLTEREARQRVAAQISIDDKVRRADHVIRTGGSFEDTNRQVLDVHAALLRAVPPATV